MKIIRQLSVALLLSIVLTTTAQTSKAELVIQKAEKAYIEAKGVNAAFSMQIKNGKNNHIEKGTIALRGISFFVETASFKCWYDGKYQWLLPNGAHEVNLSEPSEKEMELYNPNKLFGLHKKGYSLKYVGESKNTNKVADIVELSMPKAKNKETIKAQINRASGQIEHIILSQENVLTTISLSSYRINQYFSVDYFSFPSKKFPNVEIIDLR